ncbi:MAG: hypothetical protein O9337_21975 [Acidovorax sp.]|uniref:hypothetical protein n=1 Tax=Acidovorax sp. TaxID=1872122 RepID=UPI0022BDC508|nr:hypothetical protein [Acidovorax sp.]MCZ8222100.1 hypothetical protein [Acidovorax sp.]
MPHLLLNCEIAERQSPGLHQGQVAFQMESPSISTRELIALSVRAHLALQRIARASAASQAQAAPPAPTLTQALIDEGLAQGRVALPRPPEPASAPELAVVEHAEIQRALAAFEAGEFQMVVDGTLYRSHAELQLTDGSHAVFLRLRPLVGG